MGSSRLREPGSKSAVWTKVRILLVGILIFSASACTAADPESQKLSRSLIIHRHHFDPAVINVPANTPFDLIVSANDMSALTISSPSVGFETISVPPTTRPDGMLRPLTLADFRTARIPISALPSGVYEMSCQCHGRETVGKIVVQ